MRGIPSLIVLGAFLVATSSSLVARPPRPPFEQTVQDLKVSLNLSDEQLEKIRLILKSEWDNGPIERDDRDARRARFEAAEKKVMALLSDDQRDKYRDYRKNHKESFKKDMHHAAMERLHDELKLTDDQEKKVSDVMRKFQDDIAAIVQSDPKMSEGKHRLDDAKKSRDDAMKSILSDDQFKRFKSLQRGHDQARFMPRIPPAPDFGSPH